MSIHSRSRTCPIYWNNTEVLFPQLVSPQSKWKQQICDAIAESTLINGETLRKLCTISSSSTTTAVPLQIHVVNMDSIQCAQHIRTEHKDKNPVVHNMASDRVAGGGYPRGSGAQEESLCRRSLLFHSLESSYRARYGNMKNQKTKKGTNTRWYPLKPRELIYSPHVLTVRDLTNALLPEDEFFPLSYISAAAIRNPALDTTGEYMLKSQDIELMKLKWLDVLRLATQMGHRNIVLSAFGGGAFHMPSKHVAALLHDALITSDEFTYAFDHVYIAILDPYLNTQNFRIYSEQFNPPQQQLIVPTTTSSAVQNTAAAISSTSINSETTVSSTEGSNVTAAPVLSAAAKRRLREKKRLNKIAEGITATTISVKDDSTITACR